MVISQLTVPLRSVTKCGRYDYILPLILFIPGWRLEDPMRFSFGSWRHFVVNPNSPCFT
jgi:hypothetical protein